MQFVSFETPQQRSWGLLRDGQAIIDLGRREPRMPNMKSALAAGCLTDLALRHEGAKADFQLRDVRLLPPVQDPGVIACVGHNYEDHRLETQREPTLHPSIFFRHPESLVGHGQALERPRESERFDYEGELALVIGKEGRRIAEDRAWEHIAGVACFNEGSVRDWQHHTRQFGPGKNFARTAGFGPALVTCDELPATFDLELTTTVNGKVVQQARTSQMIFSIPRIVAYISTFMTVRPGDVIATGTPGGVGAKRQPPLFLRPGDVVDVAITNVGLLRNPVIQED